MTKTALPEYIDILVPSKDRPMQLHLLLESMGKHLTGVGRITITWQGSNGEYTDGYRLLKKRVLEDNAFASLRNNSREIVFRQRNSLREVYDAAVDSGDSEYILTLVDDDVFIRDYDLVTANASRFFFSNSDVISCSLRLGDNLSSQVSHSLADGVLNGNSKGHGNSLLMTGKPKFLSPIFGHLISNEISNEYYAQDYLVWSWLENLNVPHWNCITSTTSNIYRKKIYLDLFQRFGRDNFLQIESRGIRYFKRKACPMLFLLQIIFGLPFALWSKYLFAKYRIWNEDLLSVLFCKYSYRTGGFNKSVPDKAVSGKMSSVVNIGLGNSHNRKMGKEIIRDFSTYYNDGKILDYNFFAHIRYLTPLSILNEYKFNEYKGD